MPKQSPAVPTTGRVSKTYTLPPNMVRLVGYFRIEGGYKNDSYAVEALIQAGLDAEEAKAKAERAESKGKQRAA